ncbi:glycosyltransferase family 4 protein [Ramlibacter monticola]|uniref:Glycosyltransferase n=1 Tax=Ramlibacter monticola TaxID=1926872 RepID=A0A936Z5W3_9BURK|nr:glycosyltransferase [Ramlibacter monticola]
MTAVRPLHIAKFVPPPYAGVEAHADTLLRTLLPEVEGTLVAGDWPGRAEPPPAMPYRVLSARPYGLLGNLPLSPGVVRHVQRELRSGGCNLLHLHAPNPLGDIASLACGSDVPVVMTWHSDIVRQRTLLKFYRPIQRRALRRADRIVVFTPRHYDSSEQLHQIDLAAKIVKVPIGIDFSRLAPDRGDPQTRATIDAFARGRPVALTVGRHVYYKGYGYLLSAMAKLRSEAVLVMIGAGVLTPELRRLAEELGIRDRVLFLGEIADDGLVEAMHRCDFFCLPSIEPSEAFGIASAEAMSCGKPTVVCELGNGVNYLNREGVTSLTVPPCDAGALAEAIDTLAQDTALRERLGAAAARWVADEFGLAAMKRAMLDLYRSLL